MIRLFAILGLAVGLTGCIVAPPYGYGYEPAPAYESGPGYYTAPAFDLGIGFGFGGHGEHSGHGGHGR